VAHGRARRVDHLTAGDQKVADEPGRNDGGDRPPRWARLVGRAAANLVAPNPAVVRCAGRRCRSGAVRRGYQGDQQGEGPLASVLHWYRSAGRHMCVPRDDPSVERRVVGGRWSRHRGAAGRQDHPRGAASASPVEGLCVGRRVRRRRLPDDLDQHPRSDLGDPIAADVRNLMGVGRTA
jgi:hypothetical protein